MAVVVQPVRDNAAGLLITLVAILFMGAAAVVQAALDIALRGGVALVSGVSRVKREEHRMGSLVGLAVPHQALLAARATPCQAVVARAAVVAEGLEPIRLAALEGKVALLVVAVAVVVVGLFVMGVAAEMAGLAA